MDSRYAQRLGEFLAGFRATVQALPRVQLLPVATREELEARVSAAATLFDANRVIWADQLATLEAWRSVFGWRMSELVEASVALLNERKLVACAPVARAAFELIQESLITSGVLWESLEQVQLTPEKVHAELITVASFPDALDMALFGTTIRQRIDEVGVPRRQKLLKSRHRLEEHKLGGDIGKYYEKISDMAHPYWLGNRPFYRRSSAGTIQQVSREYDSEWAAELGEDLSTVLSWTVKAATNVLDQTATALQIVRAAFDDV